MFTYTGTLKSLLITCEFLEFFEVVISSDFEGPVSSHYCFRKGVSQTQKKSTA